MNIDILEKLENDVAKYLRHRATGGGRINFSSRVKDRLPKYLMLKLKKTNNLIRLIKNICYDFMRVLKYTTAVNLPKERAQLRALIIMNYHGIEKGLSLKNPRPFFGVENISITMLRLQAYIESYGYDDTVDTALSAIEQYYEKYQNLVDIDKKPFMDKIHDFLEKYQTGRCFKGGVKSVTKDDILQHAAIDMENFFGSRYSIRQFSDEEVELETIKKAVEMAKKTPSVCNRQAWKAIVLQTPDKVKRALEIQGGARGFEGQINKVLVITTAMSSFQSIGERYQGWIDGGMFAMSVIYALHSLGLGTCCLNWSKEYPTDLKFKNTIGIKKSDTIIMLIAVGHMPEKIVVAKSERKQLEETLEVL